MKTVIIIVIRTIGIICISILLLFFGGIIGSCYEYKFGFHVSYYDVCGKYQGSSRFDSIAKYPDSTVYYFKGARLCEPADLYFYYPEQK